MKKLPVFLLLVLSACVHVDHRRTAPAPSSPPQPAEVAAGVEVPKNIILVVGDGFGFAHLSTARLLLGEQLRMSEFPVAGIVQTRSASSLVTDSAAGASAMATGVKAPNGGISVDAEGTPQPTILQRAEELGKATGVVTTTYFFDATPAAFAAHAKSRRETESIVDQMLRSGMEIVAGAGSSAFGTEGRPSLRELADRHGFQHVETRAALGVVDATTPILITLPKMVNDLESVEIPLDELARFAIDRLSRAPGGFFLVIENEGIDSASHENVTDEVFSSIRSLDRAVGVALDFAREHGNTLVIATADHETGAMQLYESEGQLEIRWGTRGHTGSAVPLLAFGPGSGAFSGLIDNTDIGKRLLGFW